ncbi:predicted dithiol-disulfide isomerase involved in polyketide biosynthesis [Hungatella hathewayi CAG:224]|nr:predicted dithiol-disulfide isomerase involved in polyketide biosynthesis [Hungatella hathewayi CAG:224]
MDDLRIHRIPCRSRDIGYDHAVLSHQLIDNGRFADIGLSDDGDSRPVILRFLSGALAEVFDYLIEQLAQTKSGSSGNRNRITDTEIIKLVYIVAELFKAVHLIDSQYDRFLGLAKHVGNLGIRVHQSLAHVHDKDDDIRGRDGNLRLLSHLGQDDVTAVRFDSACVDQGEILVQPRTVGINSVSRHPRCILNNGDRVSG